MFTSELVKRKDRKALSSGFFHTGYKFKCVLACVYAYVLCTDEPQWLLVFHT